MVALNFTRRPVKMWNSAGIERVFSSMGFVHSDLRNRLDSEKVAKLAFCLRALNL